MEFKYEKKETYTQEDLNNLLEQHSNFIEKNFKDYVNPEEYNKIVEELKPFKENERKSAISKHLPENAHPEATDDIIKLANISDEDDEETIKTKLADTVNSKKYLQNTQTADPQAEKTKVEGDVKPDESKDDKKNIIEQNKLNNV